jgi:hypothetical protein
LREITREKKKKKLAAAVFSAADFAPLAASSFVDPVRVAQLHQRP